MSSKRGRKRNDTLPPNRARDVQRAFRARRAAHLQALEERVSELEEENGCLRQALNLPPANRPPLGKGPTGKDRPKNFDGLPSSAPGFPSSRESSSADSPASTRTSSLSPDAINMSSMSSRPMQVIESAAWDDALLIGDHSPSLQNAAEPPYQLAPMSAPLPSKPVHYSHYTDVNPQSLPSSSRNSMSNGIYLSTQSNYSHSTDSSMGNNYDTQQFRIRSDGREEQRQHYSYSSSSSSYPTHDPNMHPETPPPAVPISHSQSHHSQSHRDSGSLPYPHRRSLTDPQGFSIGHGFPHLPNPAQMHQSLRQAEIPRLQDAHSHSHLQHRSAYAPDGRINSLS